MGTRAVAAFAVFAVAAWVVLASDDSGRDGSSFRGAPVLKGTGPAPGARVGVAREWWPWRARLTTLAAVAVVGLAALADGWRGLLALLIITVGTLIAGAAAGAELAILARRAWISIAWISIARSCGLAVHADRRLVRRSAGADGSISVEDLPALARGRRTAPGVVSWRVIPARGQTIGDISAAADRIRTAFRAVEVQVHDDRSGRGLGVLVASWAAPIRPTIDQAPAPPPAPPAPPPPSAPVVTLDPAVTAHGERLSVPLIGPGSPHILIAGETGSGKSGWLDAILWSLAPQEHVAVSIIDPAFVTAGRWAPRLTAVASFPAERDALIGWHVEEMTRRFVAMRSAGLTAIRTGAADTPLLVLVVDEFANLTDPQKKGLQTIAQMGRKVGVVLVVATQHPSAKTIPTEARGQFGRLVCLRVSEVEAAKAALGSSDGTRDGHDPRQIPADAPGTGICVGWDTGRAVRARARFATDAQVQAKAAETAGMRVELAELERTVRRAA